MEKQTFPLIICISVIDLLPLFSICSHSLGAHFVFSPIRIHQQSTLIQNPKRALVTYFIQKSQQGRRTYYVTWRERKDVMQWETIWGNEDMGIEITVKLLLSTFISLIRQRLTCLIAVTVITKNKGRPLVTGLVGVSTITYWGNERNVMLTHNNKHMTF